MFSILSTIPLFPFVDIDKDATVGIDSSRTCNSCCAAPLMLRINHTDFPVVDIDKDVTIGIDSSRTFNHCYATPLMLRIDHTDFQLRAKANVKLTFYRNVKSSISPSSSGCRIAICSPSMLKEPVAASKVTLTASKSIGVPSKTI